MGITEYLLNWDRFCDEFGVDTSPEGRIAKLCMEMDEFTQAVMTGTKEQADDEAIDVLVVALSNVVARGIPNPLDACYFKLQRAAVKYRLRDQWERA